MDLSALSLSDLKNLLQSLPAEIARREKAEKAEARKALESFAAERGFSLSELVGETKEVKVRAPVAIKYRHPSNAELSWTGRGRQPKWIVEFLANGGTLEQLSV